MVPVSDVDRIGRVAQVGVGYIEAYLSCLDQDDNKGAMIWSGNELQQ